eukprot:4170276-Pyramimonas_sp.AAC.1
MVKGLLINAASSGPEVAAHGRAMPHGTARFEEGGRTRQHGEVMRKFRFAPLFLELRIRRIKWRQKLAERKEGNSQLLSVVLGPT